MLFRSEVPGKVGLGRCAWNFRANESNQVYLKWRAKERRAELVWALPSAADIMKLPSAAENLKEEALRQRTGSSKLTATSLASFQ